MSVCMYVHHLLGLVEGLADGFVPRNVLGSYILNYKVNIKLTGLKSWMKGGVYGCVIKDT